jgi:hypothetical protein
VPHSRRRRGGAKRATVRVRTYERSSRHQSAELLQNRGREPINGWSRTEGQHRLPSPCRSRYFAEVLGGTEDSNGHFDADSNVVNQ